MSDVVAAVTPVEGQPSAEVANRLKKSLFGPKEEIAPQVSEEAPASSVPTDEVEAPQGEEGTPEVEQAEPGEKEPVEATEPKFTANLGGKNEELPVSKLIALAQQGHDYTQKTQALASEKKQLESHKVEVSNLQQTLATELGAVRQMYQSFAPTPEAMNAALQRGDTAEYLRMQQQVNALNAMAQRQGQLTQAQQQQHHAAIRSRITEEGTLLVQKAPVFSDDSTHQKVSKYLLESGFLPDEIFMDERDPVNRPGIVDHRQLIVAHKAMLWDELQAKSATTQKKIEAAPKLAKPAARQEAAAVSDERFKQAKTSFLQAGTVRDISSADRRALAKRLGLNS